MKIYSTKDGTASEHEHVDAQELIATGAYSATDPNADPGVAVKTSGEVLRDSAQARKDDSQRAGFQQQADSTSVRDAQKMAEKDPVAIARTRATAARAAATTAQVRADAARGMPSSNAKLLSDAVDAERAATEAEAAADKAEADARAGK